MPPLNRFRFAIPGMGAVRTMAMLALIATTVGSCACLPTEQPERQVPLGGLFSLTGNWSTLGQNSKAAMEIAVEDVNKYLAGNAAGVRFTTDIEDTRLNPALALEKAKMLQAHGVQILIGPQSSAEVAYLKSFVDENGLLLVSPSSTAGALAIPGDNIFRFTPADSVEGVAVSSLMWDDGIRTVIPVWRDDAGNAGLVTATRAHFTTLGGTALEGVRYGADTKDFSPIITQIRKQVEQAIGQQGRAHVGVYLAAFDEAGSLFMNIHDDPVLGSVRWYGSDGVALSESMLRNPQAVAFAVRTGYPNPIFGLDEGARDIWEPIVQRIRARTHLEPDAFALAVYDAVWVVARGYIASGAPRDIGKLKQAIRTAAASGYGATGWMVLNDAGDRRYGDFDFWAIRLEKGGPQWVRIAQYATRTGRITRFH